MHARFPTISNAALVISALSAAALGQSFNVDIGPFNTGPAVTYGAAGVPGFWNSVPAAHTSANPGPTLGDYILSDIHGNVTGVGLHQFGGMELISQDDPSVGGDDAVLLKDAIVTHSISLKSCLYFNNLQNGLYEVLTYAWMPNHPEVTHVVFHDFTPGTALVGGAWTGRHEEGVTYARHLVTVTNGFMGPHAGLPAGGNTFIGGALNGIQLRKVGPPCDADNDADVDNVDYARYVQCQNGPGADGLQPVCIEYDVDRDEDVDMIDFVTFQRLSTGPSG